MTAIAIHAAAVCAGAGGATTEGIGKSAHDGE